MHADPDEARLVAHQVHVVVAGSDRAKLGHRLLAILPHVGLAPGVGVIEQRMLHAFVVVAAEAERDDALHVLEDQRHRAGDGLVRRVQPHRHVAAADVEADAGDADLLLVGDHAADRLRVAEMAVGADHAGDGVADRHAVAHLGDRRLVMLAEHGQRAVPVLRVLRPQVDDLGRGRRLLARVVLGPGGVAERAPQRHAARAAGLLDAAVRIEAGGDRQLAAAEFLLVRWAGHGLVPSQAPSTAGRALASPMAGHGSMIRPRVAVALATQPFVAHTARQQCIPRLV